MPQLGQRENGIGDELQWIPWGLVQRGVPSDKVFEIEYLKKSSTILQKYDHDYRWIRHPWVNEILYNLPIISCYHHHHHYHYYYYYY